MTRTQPDRPGDMAPPDDRVHQVVFRWAGNVGHRGAGIAAVAYSCPEPEARALADRLGPVLRVMGGEQRPSLVRHILPGGRVLLVRRTPGSDAQGRDSTVCHALLGPAKLLVPLYCVSLGAVPWAERGWADRVTGRIEPMPRERLNALANHMRDRMWENVRLVRRPLLCLVAQFLRTPGARLSALVGELDESLATAHAQAREQRPVPPFQELPEPALLVLWGLWWIFGSSLDRGSGSWQFATFDTMDDQAYRVVFVPAWRVSPTEDSRLRRIDLLDPGTDLAAELAATLVDHYLHWSGVKYRRLLDTDPNTSDPVHRRFHARLREVWPARYEVPDTTATGAVPVLSPPPATAPDRPQEPPPPQQPVVQDELPAHPPARHTSAPAASWTSPPEWRHQFPRAQESPSPHTRPAAEPTTALGQAGSVTEQGESPVEATEGQRNGTETMPPEAPRPATETMSPEAPRPATETMSPEAPRPTTETMSPEAPRPATETMSPEAPRPTTAGMGTLSPASSPDGSTSATAQGAYASERAVEPGQRTHPTRSGQGIHQGHPQPPSTPPPYPRPPNPPPPSLPPEFSPRGDAPTARQATGHTSGAGTGSAQAAPAIRAITDRLTPDRQRALLADALPELFDKPVMGRSTVSKFLVHKSRRARMDMSQIRALAEDLTCATNRAGHAADLRHKAEERLAQTHYEDLLSLLREPLSYAAQNIVLKFLPPAVPTEESARDLLTSLLAIDFHITAPPDPSDPYVTDLHMQRTARMIRWFFSWLVEPRTTKTESLPLTRYLSSIAASDAPAHHRILQELLIDTEEDRIPSLPKETWLAITRALYEKAHP
ncbi:hypothetical protein ACFV20_31825 [Streptomyces sp. NPDC059696]|uniref:hypothetical protein n=1 Tax=Streptomyces sp. NPDC059696 TaxID=3346911 RepID=UPI0036B6F45F